MQHSFTISEKSHKRRLRAIFKGEHLQAFCNQLVAEGLLSAEQLAQVLEEVTTTKRSLPKIVENLTDKYLTPELARQYKKSYLLALQTFHGVDFFDPELALIPIEEIAELIETLIPMKLCRHYGVLPLKKQKTDSPFLLVGMVDPDNLQAEDELNLILRRLGIGLQRLVITQEDYEQLLNESSEKIKEWETKKTTKLKQPEPKLDINSSDLQMLLDIPDILDKKEDEEDDFEPIEISPASASPIIDLVNKIITKSLEQGASVIHIEPQETSLRVRFRKQGILEQAFDPLPKKLVPAITNRFKLIANLDITKRDIPQEGTIKRLYQDKKINFAVQTMPSRYGEKIVIKNLEIASQEDLELKNSGDLETLSLDRKFNLEPANNPDLANSLDQNLSDSLLAIEENFQHTQADFNQRRSQLQEQMKSVQQQLAAIAQNSVAINSDLDPDLVIDPLSIFE